MNYLPITYDLLVEKEACGGELALFAKHFGKVNAIPLTNEVIDEFSSLFSIEWAARNLLTKEDFSEYLKVTANASAECNKVTNLAADVYEESVGPAYVVNVNNRKIALEEYIKMMPDPALALLKYDLVTYTSMKEYNKVVDLATVEYNKATDMVFEKYCKVQGQAFVEIYKRGLKDNS